jgi:hypothetical protein
MCRAGDAAYGGFSDPQRHSGSFLQRACTGKAKQVPAFGLPVPRQRRRAARVGAAAFRCCWCWLLQSRRRQRRREVPGAAWWAPLADERAQRGGRGQPGWVWVRTGWLVPKHFGWTGLFIVGLKTKKGWMMVSSKCNGFEFFYIYFGLFSKNKCSNQNFREMYMCRRTSRR